MLGTWHASQAKSPLSFQLASASIGGKTATRPTFLDKPPPETRFLAPPLPRFSHEAIETQAFLLHNSAPVRDLGQMFLK
jgi:hypothetical protein